MNEEYAHPEGCGFSVKRNGKGDSKAGGCPVRTQDEVNASAPASVPASAPAPFGKACPVLASRASRLAGLSGCNCGIGGQIESDGQASQIEQVAGRADQDLGKNLLAETMKWQAKAEDLCSRVNGDGEFLENISAYIRDSQFFLDKGDLIRAFEAVIWAWAWREIGLDKGILQERPR